MRNRYPKKDLWKQTPKSEEKKEEKPHFVLEIQDATIQNGTAFIEPEKKEGE